MAMEEWIHLTYAPKQQIITYISLVVCIPLPSHKSGIDFMLHASKEWDSISIACVVNSHSDAK